MSFFDATALAVVEGITEFIPVSSTGHLIVVRDILGMVGSHDLAIDAVLQLSSALALIVFFWRDILGLLYTVLYAITGRPTALADRVHLVAIIVGTIPAVIAGLVLEDIMGTIFRSPLVVAYALIAGSVLFIVAEYLPSYRPRRSIGVPIGERMSRIFPDGWRRGLLIGLFQSLALVPGMSRSGMTIVGGMLVGLTRAEAARFGFVLSIPILIGSGFKKLLELYAADVLPALGAELLVGSTVAFVTGLAAVWLLMRLVRTVPLTVFALYRVLVAFVIIAFMV